MRDGLLSAKCNVINNLLVKRKVLLTPLYIKLGLAKQYIKVLKKDGEAFLFMRQFFPKMSVAKLKADILIELQIRKLLQSKALELTMIEVDKSSWHAF